MSRKQIRIVSRRVVAVLFFATISTSRLFAAPLPQPDPKLAVAGTVNAVLAQANGGTVIGGEFESINGVPRRNLARLTEDGQLDLGWRADTDGTVNTLAADDAGNVYVGGGFSQIQDEPRGSLARFAPGGVLDPVWHPSVQGPVFAIAPVSSSNVVYLGGEFQSIDGNPVSSLARVSASGAGIVDTAWLGSALNSVRTIAVAADGSVFIGGQFDTAGGQPRHNIAKLSAATGLAESSWDADPDGAVLALIIDDLGRLVAGGDFDQIGGDARNGIARLLADGSADPSWQPFVGNPGYVLSMALSESGQIHVAGVFNPTGSAVGYGNLVRLWDDGIVDFQWMPVTNEGVYAIDVGLNGSVAVGGRFTSINDSLHLGFATVSADGIPGLAVDAEAPGDALAIALQPNGGTIVGGEFLKGGGMDRANILRIMPDGEVDPVWNPSANGRVWALATDGNDSVYAAGQFTRMGGTQRARFAKIDANGSGGFDAAWGVPQGGHVYTITVDAIGDVYLGGSFLGFAGIQQHYLAKSSRSGAVDSSWNPPRDFYVTDLADTVDGQLDVLYFSSGFPVNTGEIKRVSKIDGSVTNGWTPDLAADGIVSSNGTLYVHGYFNQLDGVNVPHLARILPGGIVDPSWTLQFDGYATHMAVGSDNEIYLGGAMYINNTAYELLKLSATDAQVDSTWNHSLEGFVRCLTLGQGGSLLVGGEFDTVDDVPRAGFAALGSSDAIFSDGFEVPAGQF